MKVIAAKILFVLVSLKLEWKISFNQETTHINILVFSSSFKTEIKS